MNTRDLLASIRNTSRSITAHQQELAHASQQIHDAIIPNEPYVYMMPIVAFFVGLRYATPCYELMSMSKMYRYSMLLLPLLKE
ncbi:MAG: hypothetical protein ACHQAX_04055 [Gammaproteobacteria bacterium]